VLLEFTGSKKSDTLNSYMDYLPGEREGPLQRTILSNKRRGAETVREQKLAVGSYLPLDGRLWR